MEEQKIVETWRRLVSGEDKSWVVFKHGTCVVLPHQEPDLAEKATSVLAEWGPVRAGSSAGDLTILNLPDQQGWIVLCHHPDILSYVSPGEVIEMDSPDIIAGFIGRSKRHLDATTLQVIHTEDRSHPKVI